MKKGWKIGLGILVLIVAFGTGFFAGRVSAGTKMRFGRRHRCMPAPCCYMHQHHHHGHHGHHHRMCPPAPRGFHGGYPAPTREKFCGNTPSAALGDVKRENHNPKAPKNRKSGLHIKAQETHALPKR